MDRKASFKNPPKIYFRHESLQSVYTYEKNVVKKNSFLFFFGEKFFRIFYGVNRVFSMIFSMKERGKQSGDLLVIVNKSDKRQVKK